MGKFIGLMTASFLPVTAPFTAMMAPLQRKVHQGLVGSFRGRPISGGIVVDSNGAITQHYPE